MEHTEIIRETAIFAARVRRSRMLSGLEVAAFWPEPGMLEFRVRHAYGPWRSVRVKIIGGGFAESERGNPVLAPDVAKRLRQALADKGMR
jgi:hypothetical protein